jgi:hypothetical protein
MDLAGMRWMPRCRTAIEATGDAFNPDVTPVKLAAHYIPCQ